MKSDEQYIIEAATDCYEKNNVDKAIAIGLTQGDGYWGKMLANGHYTSKRGDLAADYHDFCAMNSLDRTEIRSAEYFLKELKLEQKINELKKDFI